MTKAQRAKKAEQEKALQAEFEKAMEEYEAHFDKGYPYAIGWGYCGKTPEENIRIIREAIEKDEPVVLHPQYKEGCIY